MASRRSTGGGQPVSVRSDRRATGAGFDDLHREHRHRRSRHDPRRGKEPRSMSRSWSIRPTMPCVLAELDAAADDHAGAAPQASPRRPMRAPPPTMRRSRLVRREAAEDARRSAAPSAARLVEPLRYGENPHQRRPSTARRRRARASPPRARCRARAVLQQHQRHRCGLRMRRGVRSAAHGGLRHRQARQSVRRRRGRKPGRGLSQGARLRSRLGVRRHRGAQPPARCRCGAARSRRFSPR